MEFISNQEIERQRHRMKANRIILIVIFFGIGYVLFYKDKPGPIGKLMSTISGVFKSKEIKNDDKNPYKAPEPTNDNVATATKNGEVYDDVATATNKKSESSEKVEEETSIFDKIKDKIFSPTEGENPSDGITIPDFAFPAIKKSDQIVKHKNYVLKYVEEYEQAAWIVHKLRGEYTKGRASRQGMEFEPDSKVKTRSALSSDYSGSGYDRGHMVPAGDFKCCPDLMKETFYTSNISPQNQDLNRGLWENIESRMRGWSVRDEELYIVTGPVLRKGLPTIGRYNEVAVPEYFYKIALFYQPKTGKKPRAIAFLVPNEALIGKRMNSFVVSVDEVEAKTGIDFFSKLPDDVEKDVEAMNDWSAWTKIQ